MIQMGKVNTEKNFDSKQNGCKIFRLKQNFGVLLQAMKIKVYNFNPSI